MNTLVGEEAVKVREVPFTYGPQYDLTYKKKKKKSHNLEDVMPTGVDDGKGARRLLNVYVDETLTRVTPHSQALVNFDILSDDFRNKPFLDQINHVQMRGIPLLSQVARQDALWPYNSSKKKKHYIAFAKRLQRNDTGLLHARLSSEAIDDGIIKILEYALQKNTALQHLALHKNSITDKGIEMLCLAIRWHPTLHTLWLGANPFCDIGARHISMLLSRNKNIKELNISNRWPSEIWQKNMYELHPHITYVGAQYISKQLMRGSGLTSLSLAEQRVRDDGAIYLFQALKHCHLRVLNLRENELSDRCCVELRTSLEANPVLQELILSHNQITNDGAINIAYGLARNTSLHLLDLGYNWIEKAGLDGLFLCLKYNQTLTALITVRNKDPDKRAEELVYNRVNSIFSFTHASNHTPGAALKAGGFFGAGHTVSHTHAGRAATPPRIKRLPSPSGNTILSLDLNMPAGVEILGKSVHSRSFRSVHIDSKEASRSNSTRSASFRALSQQFDTESDNGETSHAVVDHAADRPATPAAPMLGQSSRKTNTAASHEGPIEARVGTPPAPMLGSNKVRPPLHQQQERARTPNNLSPAGKLPTRAENADIPPSGSDSPTATASAGATPKLKGDRKSRSVSMLVPEKVDGVEVTVVSPAPTETAAATVVHSEIKDNAVVRPINDAKEAEASSSPVPHPKLVRKSSSKKFHTSFRRGLDSEQVNDLPDVLARPPPALFDLGRPVRSRDVGKTISIPNVKNMGIRPIRTSISPLKDSAQHLMYLRISTPFDPPDERPYSILNVGRDHLNEVKRVRKLRQDPKYKYDKAFKINNTPKQIRHQAALPKVPQSFWKDWQHKTRLQYIDGIDNAAGVTSTKLDVVTPRELTSAETQRHEHEQEHQHQQPSGGLTRSGTAHTKLHPLPDLLIAPSGSAGAQGRTVSTPTATSAMGRMGSPKSRESPLRRSLLSTDLSSNAPNKSIKTSMKRIGGSDFSDNHTVGFSDHPVGVSFATGDDDADTFGFSSKGGGFGGGSSSVKISSSAKFGSASMKISASSKEKIDPALDPTSAYYIYANDPSQSYRKHLTFKNNGVTPGKILAARRKENAIKRQQKLDEQAEEERQRMQNTSAKLNGGFVIANTSMKGLSK